MTLRGDVAAGVIVEGIEGGVAWCVKCCVARGIEGIVGICVTI